MAFRPSIDRNVFNAIIWMSFTLILMMEVMSVSSQTTTMGSTSTTMSTSVECSQLNSSCESCVQNASCYYCFKTNTCDLYPYTTLQPQSKCGSIKDMAWKTCLVNLNVLLIVGSSVGGAVILSLAICCCYCCRKVKRAQIASQLAKWERQRADRQRHQDERRLERQIRRNEIRQKYGLGSKDSNNYSRFD